MRVGQATRTGHVQGWKNENEKRLWWRVEVVRSGESSSQTPVFRPPSEII